MLLKGNNLLNFIGATSVWVSASFCYYLLGVLSKYIKGDIFITAITCSIGDILAYITSGLIMKFIGLKFTLILCYIISIIGMTCYTIFDFQN